MAPETEPSIEVAIPFYGRFDYLGEAVESVLGQTDGGWTLRIHDDNVDVDPSVAEWVEGLRDTRIRYYANERNLGVSGNFNRCVEAAESTYVALMGSDDRMLPGYVAAARRAIAEADGEVVYQPGVQVIDAAGARVSPLADRLKTVVRPRARGRTTVAGEALVRSLMRGTWTYFPSLLWPTALVRQHGFDARSRVVQDTRLLVDLALGGTAVCIDPEITFEYRRHSSAASASSAQSGARFTEERAMYAEFRDRLRERGWTSASGSARWHVTSRLHAVVVAGEAFRDRRPRLAYELLRRHALGA